VSVVSNPKVTGVSKFNVVFAIPFVASAAT